MGWSKHGDPMPSLRAAPKGPEHHSVVEAREMVVDRARGLLSALDAGGFCLSEGEALRDALAMYDQKRTP